MLKIKDLCVSVAGKEVLSGINLEIKEGHIFALLGPNGSGKTSLIMTIMGFSDYKITRGSIYFRDKKINDLSTDERSKLGIGLMMQRPPTIRGVKLRQIVGLIKQKGFEAAKESQELNLTDFMDRDLNMGFSGGELKRSELLQLLACAPKFSLYDEPESGVDLENMALVGKVMNKILNKNKGNLGLIITHTGYIFDYVKPHEGCVLVGGRLHCVGDPKAILDTVKKHGYEGCVACSGEKLRRKVDG